MSDECTTTEFVLTCHSCGAVESQDRGVAERLCELCFEKHQKWLERIGAKTPLERKLNERCIEPGCPRDSLKDNGRCQRCRDAHCIANNKWKRSLKWRREQLTIAFGGT